MPHEAVAVLGIDAAWTEAEPSGVALVVREGSRWKALRVAPSYETFSRWKGWPSSTFGGPIDVNEMLQACRELLGHTRIMVVAVDMPLSERRIEARRAADRAVSRFFGHCQCAVHSPSPDRPGKIGRRLHEGLGRWGFSLQTARGPVGSALIEVYPHVALLGMTGRAKRVPYKAGKTTRYWPGASIKTRKQRLVHEWNHILDFLRRDIDNIELPVPDADAHTLRALKSYEDALDGLICAWVGAQYVENAAVPLGDAHAAIWVPTTSMQFAKDENGA